MKEAICFLLTLSWSHSCCDVGNCQLPFAFSQNFIWILQERVVVALLRRLHRSRWGNLYFWSVVCDFREIWAYNFCFLQLADCLWFVNFFLTYFKANTSYGLFSLLLMIFSPFGLVWTRCLSLNFRFRLLLWYKEPDHCILFS